jgi:hypothetical protein
MAGIPYTKTLKLSLDTTDVECQLTTAQLVDEPEGGETLTTFCLSEDVVGTPKYSLSISGFQSWAAATDAFQVIHDAYLAGDTMDFELTVGSKTRSGVCRALNDPPFGGDSGAAMTADVTLAVVGDVTDGTATP